MPLLQRRYFVTDTSGIQPIQAVAKPASTDFGLRPNSLVYRIMVSTTVILLRIYRPWTGARLSWPG